MRKKETKQFIPAARFHILTPLFDSLLSLFGLGKKYRDFVLKHIEITNPNAKVLDAGCGTGTLAMELLQKHPGIHFNGVDADEKILTIARKKTSKIKFSKAFLQKLPFEDDSFDIIYSSLVFHHIPSKDKVKSMKEIYRVLKSDGYFLLSDFGKPKNIFLAVFSWFTMFFEEGYDNYHGKIPLMLKEAGFHVEEVARYKFNLSLLKCGK
ncbi:class I SAM-dependent methyltransferase [Candidatus Woesearchaeota archaeon]|nr:class I SAM-dependent methyltransferase [Candidatus Woesearchaeota archaeon]